MALIRVTDRQLVAETKVESTYRNVPIVHDDLSSETVRLVGKDPFGSDGMIPYSLSDCL